MVAHLARCQVDPGGAALVDRDAAARVRAGPHVHHTHPDGINVLAGTRDGERLVAECFGDEAAWIPYIRPGFTLAKQVGTAVRGNPRLQLVVLAKHGLVVWGDTAEEAYRRTIEVINRAVEFVNARTAGEQRFDGPAGRAGRRAAGRAARAARRGLERAAQGAGGRHVAARPRVRLLARRAGAGQGGRRLPRPPRAHEARPAVDPVRPRLRGRDVAGRADPRARGGVPRRLPRLRRRQGGAGRPGRARGADPERRPDRGRDRRRRRRGSRATSTTARSR